MIYHHQTINTQDKIVKLEKLDKLDRLDKLDKLGKIVKIVKINSFIFILLALHNNVQLQ